MRRAARRALYSGLHVVLWVILGLVFRLRSSGASHLPRQGPVVLAANHCHNLDPVFLGVAARRPVSFMAKAELFDVPVLSCLIRTLYAFPVHRESTDRAALRRAAEVLRSGRVVGIFPEGTRRSGRALGPAHPGAAMVAMDCGAPIVPAAIIGTDRLVVRRAGIPLPGKVTVRFGCPIEPIAEAPDRRAERERLMDETMRAIAELGGFDR